ncbi:hypothetical protein VNO77_17915 [Canavalia gladiata]|uniref:VQ domain-containing protein n=1 Tax=Canavalia gladiata TaxID=3824 RepID=A0AAN9LNG4_CANGL
MDEFRAEDSACLLSTNTNHCLLIVMLPLTTAIYIYPYITYRIIELKTKETLSMNSYARKEVQLQGPKPAALMVNKNSTKIKKQHLSRTNRSPVIVYLRSPKVIHVRPEEFMGLVQQLTGNHVSAAAIAAHASSQPCSNMDETCQKMEKRSTVTTTMDANPIEDFSIGLTGLSVDFHALMHFVDFV